MSKDDQLIGLKAIHDFLFLSVSDPIESPIEHVGYDLFDRGIDIDASFRKVEALIAVAKTQRRLEKALSKREKLSRFLESLPKRHVASESPHVALETLRRFLGGEVDAAVYCRKLEKLTPEDIESLFDDLQALDMISDVENDKA